MAEICAINANIQEILLTVCHSCLTNVESVYGGFPGHEFALSTRKSSNYHLFDSYVERELALATADAQFMRHEHFQMSSDIKSSSAGLSPSKAARLRTTRMKQLKRSLLRKQQHPANALDEIRWTMAAIRRRKCEHLAKFVYLVDFMQMDVYFAMVLRSVAVVRDHLLRGANAMYIQKLTEHQDFVLAFHRTIDVTRNNVQDTAVQLDGSNKPSVDSSGMIPTDKRRVLSLSKQQTKRFLRVALDGKFHMQHSHMTLGEAKSAAVWMESKFEALFLQALLQRTERQQLGDTFTLDDLLTVVEFDVAQELVLPPFYGSVHSIFLRTGADSGGQVATQGESLVTTELEQEAEEDGVRSIAILAPVPLFQVDLELVHVTEDHELQFNIKIQPDLDEILFVVRDLLNNFVELFDGIPPLVAHPDLFSILKFSDDIRSSVLEMTGNKGSSNINRNGALIQQPNGDGDDGDEDERRPQNTAERLTERVNDNTDYSLLRIHIDELLANSLEAADRFVDCYATMVAQHTENQLIDFDGIATKFRENEYSLVKMSNDVTNLNNQVRDIQALSTSQNVEFLRFNVQELQKSLLPSPLRSLKKLKELFPSLAHEKCDQFLDFARSACTRIQKPMVASLEAFASYLLHLKVGC